MDKERHVIITVTCDEGHVIDQYIDSIDEKYPFFCGTCDDDKRDGKYPWSLTTQVVEGKVTPIMLEVLIPGID